MAIPASTYPSEIVLLGQSIPLARDPIAPKTLDRGNRMNERSSTTHPAGSRPRAESRNAAPAKDSARIHRRQGSARQHVIGLIEVVCQALHLIPRIAAIGAITAPMR